MTILSEAQKIDFIKKAAFIADQSTCNYKIGCVGVISLEDSGLSIDEIRAIQKFESEFKSKNGLLYLKTWNETLKGEIYCQSCDSNGKKICIREQENLKGRDFQKVCSIHAEQNLISKCAKYGIKTAGMIMFLTNTPCYICAKSIIQSGIKEIYYLDEHTDRISYNILIKNSIQISKLNFN